MTDIAYEFMKTKNGIPFLTLWNEVCTTLGFSQAQSEAKIAQFYSALMLDARFTALPDNKWDLRKNYTYKDTHFDTSSIIIDDDNDRDDDDLTSDPDFDEIEEIVEENEEENF